MRRSAPAMQPGNSEQGYVLAGAIILLAVFMIILSMAIPQIRKDIRRDQELETIHRGQQYVRAFQLFYRRFHRYPVSMDELEETNGLRFLRRRYPDPLTRSNDWKPVYLGQNRAPLSMGLFGAVLNAGAALPSSSGDQSQDSILGSPPPSAFNSFSSSAGSSGDSQQDSSGMSFGAGPIIGVSPGKSMDSIVVYKTKSNYEEWEFIYDPAADPLVPKWGQPINPTNVGAPGMGPTAP